MKIVEHGRDFATLLANASGDVVEVLRPDAQPPL
jgi:hypothetical protein